MGILDTINYQVVPPVFLVAFTGIVQVLVKIGNPASDFPTLELIFGNSFAWKLICGVVLWALIWLWIPGKTFSGPPTEFGYVPVYKANGELYYFSSVAALGLWAYFNPSICLSIYNNYGPLLGGLNTFALSLCIYLLVKAKLKKDEKDPYLRNSKYPIMHEFYRGMELHPRIFGIDVKQLTNCRIGLMLWQWLVLIHYGAAYQLHGFNPAHLSCTILQTIYLYKFYHWETGYFNTLDITLDRAGYYICWGCVVWVPVLYTFHSYYFVHFVPEVSIAWPIIITIIGILSIYYNYDVDRQKEIFRTKQNVKIWGQKPKVVKASFVGNNGKRKETELLVSGWWGVARKINYTFELASAYAWCAGAGLQYKFWPYLYFLFLATLLIHRIYRDEKKCNEKYGNGWIEYCKKVPYRLIPYIY